MCSRCGIRKVATILTLCAVCAGVLLPQEDRDVQPHQPDLGPHWPHSQVIDIRPIAVYSGGLSRYVQDAPTLTDQAVAIVQYAGAVADAISFSTVPASVVTHSEAA